MWRGTVAGIVVGIARLPALTALRRKAYRSTICPVDGGLVLALNDAALSLFGFPFPDLFGSGIAGPGGGSTGSSGGDLRRGGAADEELRAGGLDRQRGGLYYARKR